MSEWTPQARAAYMRKMIETLNIGGIWAMSMGRWVRVSEKELTLTPLISRAYVDAIGLCQAYAQDARRAGYLVDVLASENLKD